ncbi:MAG: MFS transporter [Pirellulales bacterium]|nr:MFS transporter [Pirellulales bacterium]
MSGGGSDVSHDSFWTQLGSFSGVFWIANWIELVERYAYYGVRVGVPIFMVAPFTKGGIELSQIQKGEILAVWAAVQCFVPILSGGFADRYGYKLSIAISSVLVSLGYLIMGFSPGLAVWLCGRPLAEARPLGLDNAYEIFFAGAMFVAFGTAVFKPGVQGLVANKIPKKAAALGWGMFYQMVNIGGFIGPMVTGALRGGEEGRWIYVFVACAAGPLLNLVPLLIFREPEHGGDKKYPDPPLRVLYKAICGLLEPRLFFFTISFAGFWLMFYQLFDILPNFINDWIDSRAPAQALDSVLTQLTSWGHMLHVLPANKYLEVPKVTDGSGNMVQEWIVNLNALLISIFAFGVAFFAGKMASLRAIAIGIAIAALAILGIGQSMNGWWLLGMIAIFSFGEMMASPTKLRFLAGIAPPGKEGLYMGYANFTVGIGWSVGSVLAGYIYEACGDKTNLARRYLVDVQGLSAETVKAVSKDNLTAFFQKETGLNIWEMRETLWNMYEPYWMWALFAGIGVAAMVAIIIYGRVVTAANANPAHSLNTHGDWWVRAFLAPICLLFLVAMIYVYIQYGKLSIGIFMNGVLFWVLLLVSWINRPQEDSF